MSVITAKSLIHSSLIALSIIWTFQCHARQLSEREAKSIACQYLSLQHISDHDEETAENLQTVFTPVLSRGGDSQYYIFNRESGKGFIIVAGDDKARLILGKSDSGAFDYTSAPDNIKWWLGEYVKEIDYLRSNPSDTPQCKESNYEGWKAVEPLLRTKWGQSAPFNDKCPEYVSAGIIGRSVTGCVATATAQIVNYHRWPKDHGKGEWSYKIEDKSLSFDYEAANFDWSKMRETYSIDSDPEEKAAVAELMLACGIGVEMYYGPNESSSGGLKILRMLVDNLNYDPDIQYLQRRQFSREAWEALIYSELVNGRPIFYEGASGTVGHAFVCDGYEPDGLFHINWGWEGNNDGYFALSALNPGGYGGHTDGYNSEQSAVIGIQPDKGSKPHKELSYVGSFKYQEDEHSFWVSAIYNYSLDDLSVKLGIEIEDANGSSKFLPSVSKGTVNIPGLRSRTVNYQTSVHYEVDIPSLPTGVYTLYPAYMENDGEWQRGICRYGEQSNIALSVDSNGNMIFTNPGPSIPYNLEVTNVLIPEETASGKTLSLTLDIQNKSSIDYVNPIFIQLVRDNRIIESIALGCVIDANQSAKLHCDWTLYAPKGEYQIEIRDYAGNKVNPEPTKIKVLESEEMTPPSKTGLKIISVNESVFYAGLPKDIILLFQNTKSVDIKENFYVNIIDSIGNVLQTLHNMNQAFPADVTLRYLVQNINVDLSAGSYFLDVIDSNGSSMCVKPFDIQVYNNYDGVWYGIDESRNAFVAPYPPNSVIMPESGYIIIPEAINIKEERYEVTYSSPYAFDEFYNLDALFLLHQDFLIGDPLRLTGKTVVYVHPNNYSIVCKALGERHHVYEVIPDNLSIPSQEVFKNGSKKIKLPINERTNSLVDFTVFPTDGLDIKIDGFDLFLYGLGSSSYDLTLQFGQPNLSPLTIKVVVKDIELGDINKDYNIDVADLAILIEYLKGNNIEGVTAEMANINCDENSLGEPLLDDADITAEIEKILTNNNGVRIKELSSDITAFPVSFNYEGLFIAMQTDILMNSISTDDLKISEWLDKTHSVYCANIGSGKLRVIAFSDKNAPVLSPGSHIFTVDNEGKKVDVENTIFVDPDHNSYRAELSTGIVPVESEENSQIKKIFDLYGREIRTHSIETLPTGIYIEKDLFGRVRKIIVN